ncbi:MAG: glycosyltransferase family 2 protein [Solirubrobacteraceae bacterium MAG38_C4-C5]|nr:glycosyltransferase family 2 protein [Candidatus Siliceabacter maunaloa]
MDDRLLTVIVPARDAAATLPALLAALGAQVDAGPFEVVVADDGSRDGTPGIARAAGARVAHSAGPGSGPGAARNAGLALARGSILAFTDADCIPTPDWLRRGRAALAHADLVQGAVLPPPGRSIGPFDRHVNVTAPRGLFEAANLLARRELVERLGGFEPGVALATGKEMGEDAWLGWRAVRSGARTAFCADALVHHEIFPRSAAGLLAERTRVRFFPELARRIPELRETLFWRRVFLSRRSAAFDLALVGLGVGVRSRRAGACCAAIPYLAIAVSSTRHRGRRRPWATLVYIAADAVGAAALVVGSVRARTPVL